MLTPPLPCAAAGEVDDYNVSLNGQYATVKVQPGTIKKQGGTGGPKADISDAEKAEDPIFVKMSKTGKKTQAWSALTDTEVEELAKEEARKDEADRKKKEAAEAAA